MMIVHTTVVIIIIITNFSLLFPTGKTCIAFGPTHANVITKCCSIVDNGLGDCEQPPSMLKR